VEVKDHASGWFVASRHKNYQGSGLDVRSELVVPLFDTSRKCLGAIKCINKSGGAAFREEDVKYVSEVAHHIGMMLEGPDAGLRRVLALSRQRMQEKNVLQGTLGHGAVLCSLEKAEHLPSRSEASKRRFNIDPYVTFSIVRGDPLEQAPGVQQRIMRARNKDRKAALRRFAKSGIILEDANPSWDETIAVALPQKYRDVPAEELWVFVLLWDYDSLKADDLVAQTAFPLSDVQAGKLQQVVPHKLSPIPGQEDLYDLEKARIWVSITPFEEGAEDA